MFRSLLTLIADEARRKPYIAELVERAPSMTDEEIAATNVQLPWMRKALLEVKQKAKADIATGQAAQYAEMMGGVTEHLPATGIIVRHVGDDVFVVPPSKGGQRPLPYEIKRGDLLLVTPEETWAGSIPLGHPSIPCEIVERDATRARMFELIAREAPGAPPEVAPASRFTIFRS